MWKVSLHEALGSCSQFVYSAGRTPHPPAPPELAPPAPSMTLGGQVEIVTCVATPHREQAEGQRSAGGREETRQVMLEGKVGAHHLHAEQNT